MRREVSSERIGIEGLLLVPVIAIAPLLQSVVPMVAIGTRLAVGAMMAALLAIIILDPARRVCARGSYKFWIILPFFLLISWGMISSIVSPSNIKYSYIIQLIGLFVFILILGIVQLNYRAIKTVMLSGMLSGLVVSLYGLEGFVTGEHFRVMGWFAGANQFGGILLAQMFFPLYFIYYDRPSSHWIIKVVAFSTAFLMVFAMLMSGSRSVVLSLLILLALLFATRFRAKKYRFAIYGMTAILLLGAIYFAAVHDEIIHEITARYDFLRVFRKPEVLFGGRLPLWEAFLVRAVERPVVGFGFSPATITVNGVTTHPHNLFILILYQTGIVGLTLLLWLLGGLMVYLKRYLHFPIGRLMFCLSGALILREFWEITLLANNISIVIIFWTILAISVGGMHNNRRLLSRTTYQISQKRTMS